MLSIIEKAVAILAPHSCIGCQSVGSVLCDNCIRDFIQPMHSRCAGCRSLSDDFRTCKACYSWLPLRHVFVATSYDGIGEQLVKALKFSMQRQAAESMANIIDQANISQAMDVLLCSIPTASNRVRERGFDHAKLLTKLVSKKLEIEMASALRRRTNVRQLGSSRKKRIEQMLQEFELKDASVVRGRDIVLVDDVFTTGATLSGAARVLRSAGAKSVSAIVFAQKN